MIGGATPSSRNVISGNLPSGISVGAANTVINVTPQYKDSDSVWQKYSSAPSQSGSTYTFADPVTVQGGGSAGDTSIVVTMIDPGGGGLTM